MPFGEAKRRGVRAAGVLAACLAIGPSIALGAGEAREALKSGEQLYQKGEYDLALARLQTARRADPDDAEAALFLGLTYLRLDNPGEAAIHWHDYVRLSKDENLRADVRKFVTIVLRETNRRIAEEALEQEQSLLAQETDPKTVAVAPFQNAGDPEYAPLGKAFAALLIANLSAIPDLRVLERERVQALLDEAKLGASGLVERTTAARAGKLLRAGRITAGSYADFRASPLHLRVEASLIDVDAKRAIGSAQAEGLLAEFHGLVPKLSTALAAVAGRPVEKLDPEPAKQVKESHTRKLAVILAFGRGLEAKDRGDYPAAREELEKAVAGDPNFRLARLELERLPAALVSLVAIGNTVESAALAGAVGRPRGLSIGQRAALIGGGALVVGGIAAGVVVATGGGGGDGGGGGGAPILEGVQDRTVVVGDMVILGITGRDPEGTTVTLDADNETTAPGSIFSATPGNPANGVFRWTPAEMDIGPHDVTFTATDAGNPPQTTRQAARITVTEEGATPTSPAGATGTPTATVTPTHTTTPTTTPTP